MRRGAWYALLAVAMAALMLVPVALAARGGGKRGGPDRMARMAEELDLTAEQRTQVRGIVEEYRGGALGDHQRALREARRQLRRVVHDLAATDAQVQDAAREVASHEAFVAVERHRMAVEIGRVLTDEQREKAAELRERRKHRMEDRLELE